MLSDQGADLVMAEIEYMTLAVDFLDISKAQANAMLNHLYELHRLRDIELYNDLCEIIYEDRDLLLSRVFSQLTEMQDA